MNKILFDMDWTLYSFDSPAYKWSKLEKEVQKNALRLLKKIDSWNNSEIRFEQIKKDYWENFSIAFEEIFSITKQRYFDIVWDINPKWIIIDDRNSLSLFEYLKDKWFEIYIVSESPIIWINRVLSFLKIENMISWIFTWQAEERKSNGLLYDKVIDEIWKWYFMVWDQVIPDIINARNKWFIPIYINKYWEKDLNAEYNILDLNDIYKII